MASPGTNIGPVRDSGHGFVSAETAEKPSQSQVILAPVSELWESNSGPEPYVDAKEGSAFLRIHPKTLMRLARAGTAPAYSLSEGTRQHWRFLISELDKWMRTKVNSSAHPVRSVSPERRK
jgi:hypothetical protein